MNLKEGDIIGIVSQSWCGPETFPFVHDAGIDALKKMGYNIKEFEYTRKQGTPEQRAKDLTDAFLDPDVKAIISSIGGDDCTFLLEYLDLDLIAKHQKPFMGYSDPTALMVVLSRHGIPCYYGPSTMAGLAQLSEYPKFFELTSKSLEGIRPPFEPSEEYSDEYEDWNSGIVKVKDKRKNEGFRFLNNLNAEGELFGGCVEVLEFLKGTKYWPKDSFWDGKILFLETSEDVPSLTQVKYFLRNYGWSGVLQRVNGLIFGRVRGYSDDEKKELEEIILQVLDEFKVEIPVVANFDIGHTDPRFVLKYGEKVRIGDGTVSRL